MFCLARFEIKMRANINPIIPGIIMSLLALLRELGVCTAASRTSSSLFHSTQPSISPFSLGPKLQLTFFTRTSPPICLFHLTHPPISPFFTRLQLLSHLFHSAQPSILPFSLGPKLQLTFFTRPSPPSCLFLLDPAPPSRLFHSASTSISPLSHSSPALSELIHSAFSPFSLGPTLHLTFSSRPRPPSHLFSLGPKLPFHSTLSPLLLRLFHLFQSA